MTSAQLSFPCPHCKTKEAVASFQVGGPWLLFCQGCFSTPRQKFGILHYTYLYQVLRRAGLGPWGANNAIVEEANKDGIACDTATWDMLQQQEESHKLLKGPAPRVEVSGGRLDFVVLPEEGSLET